MTIYVTGLISGFALALIVYGILQERKLTTQREALSADLLKMMEDLSQLHNSSVERLNTIERNLTELRLKVDTVRPSKQITGFGVMGV